MTRTILADAQRLKLKILGAARGDAREAGSSG